MNIDTESRHITLAGGNIYADLGFESEEASVLKAESDRIITQKLAIEESLIAEIFRWIKEKNLNQIEVAKILGITRPMVFDMVQKKSVKFTIDALIDMLMRAGKQVTVSVHWSFTHPARASLMPWLSAPSIAVNIPAQNDCHAYENQGLSCCIQQICTSF